MAIDGQPGVLFPQVARANDLPSCITSVNQLKDIVTILTNQFSGGVHWVERSRRTQIVRIVNAQDQNNWVDVERIVQITWQNIITQEILQFNYDSPDAPRLASTTRASIEIIPSPDAARYAHRSPA